MPKINEVGISDASGGGASTSGIFEWELLNAITCIYLPPLRDAESRLQAYRGSRLARMLKNLNKISLSGEEAHPLETEFKEFQEKLVGQESIQSATNAVRANLVSALGPILVQDASLQFTESNFDRIVERLRILFYPLRTADGKNHALDMYRELSENSLGYNNILYLATILAELEGLDANTFLKVLVIEEPEAHLHPQLQIRLLQYLQSKAQEQNIQIIVTSHSPTLVSSVELEHVVVLTQLSPSVCPVATQIKNCGLAQRSKFFLQRWLDITKSTLLFAQGVILVEGISEAILMQELSRRVIEKLVRGIDNPPQELHDFSVSVINIGGIYFSHFIQLFKGYLLDSGGVRVECDFLPLRCAGLTDCDPEKDKLPTSDNQFPSKNHEIYLVDELKDHERCRVFSNLKTFEYDLALEGNNLHVMSKALILCLETDGPIRSRASKYVQHDWTTAEESEKAEAAAWLLDKIDGVSKGIYAQQLAYLLKDTATVFEVPTYIASAITWVLEPYLQNEQKTPEVTL